MSIMSTGGSGSRTGRVTRLRANSDAQPQAAAGGRRGALKTKQSGQTKSSLRQCSKDATNSNSRDSDSTLTPVSPASRRARKAATTDGADRSDSKVDNLFLENAGSDRDQEAEGEERSFSLVKAEKQSKSRSARGTTLTTSKQTQHIKPEDEGEEDQKHSGDGQEGASMEEASEEDCGSMPQPEDALDNNNENDQQQEEQQADLRQSGRKRKLSPRAAEAAAAAAAQAAADPDNAEIAAEVHAVAGVGGAASDILQPRDNAECMSSMRRNGAGGAQKGKSKRQRTAAAANATDCAGLEAVDVAFGQFPADGAHAAAGMVTRGHRNTHMHAGAMKASASESTKAAAAAAVSAALAAVMQQPLFPEGSFRRRVRFNKAFQPACSAW